jgi:hypothetical protein
MQTLLSFISLLMLYLGFSATLGILMRTLSQNGRITRFVFLAFVIFPYAIALPWELYFNIIAWVLGAVVTFTFFRLSPNSISRQWLEKFTLIYLCLLMVVVSAWSLFYEGQSILWMTAFTLLAGITCAIRIFRPRVI